MRNKIIITGENGYIGNAIRERFSIENNSIVEMLNVRDEKWKSVDFSTVRTIIHCAALVHKCERSIAYEEYKRVNCDLTLQLAEKAKVEGVEYFIFLSTEGIYGTSGSCFKDVILTNSTVPKPKSKYERSKYEAELKLKPLEDVNFKIAILRPPFVYGNGCPGNYQKLRRLVLKYGFVPNIKNQKSMIYIENLSEFIYWLEQMKESGIFVPQDLPYRNTTQMALLIAQNNQRNVICTRLLNPFIRIASIFIRALRVAFGSEYFEMEMSCLNGIEYSKVCFEESIRRTEKNKESEMDRTEKCLL